MQSLQICAKAHEHSAVLDWQSIRHWAGSWNPVLCATVLQSYTQKTSTVLKHLQLKMQNLIFILTSFCQYFQRQRVLLPCSNFSTFIVQSINYNDSVLKCCMGWDYQEMCFRWLHILIILFNPSHLWSDVSMIIWMWCSEQSITVSYMLRNTQDWAPWEK